MNKFLFVFFVIFMFFASSNTYAKHKPKIKFENTNIELGPLSKEERVQTYNLTFKNTGKAELQLDRVESACGCLKVDYNFDKIAPGKTGTILVNIDLLHSAYLDLEKHIYVYSNAKNEKVDIKFHFKLQLN